MKITLEAESRNKVYLNGKLLIPSKSQNFINHSPDGFAWGYLGSGPAQLALAICLELFPKAKASRVYQDFKEQYISELPVDQDSFDKRVIDISVFIEKHKGERWQGIYDD